MTRRSTVADWMTRYLISTTPEEVLFDAVEKMAESAVRHVVVVREGRVVGILSNRDLVRATYRNPERTLDLHGVKVSEVMTKAPICTTSGTTIYAAAELMVQHGINALPVLGEHEAPEGILTSDDLLRALSVQCEAPPLPQL